jgi:hypothetical protein
MVVVRHRRRRRAQRGEKSERLDWLPKVLTQKGDFLVLANSLNHLAHPTSLKLRGASRRKDAESYHEWNLIPLLKFFLCVFATLREIKTQLGKQPPTSLGFKV